MNKIARFIIVATSLKKETYMVIAGVLSVLAGVRQFYRGAEMNQDMQLLIHTFPNTTPGNPYIIVGVILIAVGVVLLALAYITHLIKSKNSNKE